MRLQWGDYRWFGDNNMLVLTRRAGESVRIGDDIEITVMAVNGGQVRIGIKAPRDVVVDREEIAQRKQRERQLTDLGPSSMAAAGAK